MLLCILIILLFVVGVIGLIVVACNDKDDFSSEQEKAIEELERLHKMFNCFLNDTKNANKFPVFKKGDIVHFRTIENQSNKIVEAEIIGIESSSNWDYFQDNTGMGVCYCAKVEDKIIHNLWGFMIEELKEKNMGL